MHVTVFKSKKVFHYDAHIIYPEVGENRKIEIENAIGMKGVG